MSQDHYWKEFYRLKVHLLYLELQLGRTEGIDRSLKIFLAVTSSASIGAWAIWKEMSSLWAVLIAGSQVLNAVRQYLPYKERLRSISGLIHELEELLLTVETKWLDIVNGDLTESEIRKALSNLRTLRYRALKKHFPDKVLPQDNGLFAQAEQQAQAYFQNLYS
ncbi:MAG: hypothetical protein ACOYB2_13155 [Limnohabitans sp.]|jgi:hypothetical protein